MESWRVAQGSTEQRQIPIVDSNGDAIPYEGTEPLSLEVWVGNDQAPLLTIGGTWVTPASGLWSVTLSAAQTRGLDVGQYRLLGQVTDVAGPHDCYEALLVITAAPGSASARPTYIDDDDLRKIDPTVDEQLDPDHGVTGFADQCADARDWLDECLLRNYRGGNISLLGYHGLALDAWYTGGVRRTSLTNIWLRDQLKANTLIVTPRIRRLCALYALYLVYRGARSRGKEYQALAAGYLHEAHALMTCTTAELNLNGDGTTPCLPINLSTTNTLYG